MSIDIQEYTNLKKRADSLKSQADRAQGALEQHMKKLKEEFNCESIAEAEELLNQLKDEQKKIEVSYNKALGEFKEKWKNQF